MKCFYCKKEASAKVGNSKGNILNALFGRNCWQKSEIYVCKEHYKTIEYVKNNHDKLKKQGQKPLF
jgi:hypothetical protein